MTYLGIFPGTVVGGGGGCGSMDLYEVPAGCGCVTE